MRISLGPTGQVEPISGGVGEIWVGRSASGIEIVAIIAVVECRPEDHEAFMHDTGGGTTALQLVQAAALEPPNNAA